MFRFFNRRQQPACPESPPGTQAQPEAEPVAWEVSGALAEAHAPACPETLPGKEAQQEAEPVASEVQAALAKAHAALTEALQRAENAEKARARAEEEATAERAKSEAARKAQQVANAKAAIAESALEDAVKKLQEMEAWDEERKEVQKQRNAELEEQERKLGQHFHELFKAIDRNGDGFLSHTELKSYEASMDPAMRLKLGIGRWRDFLAEADANQDGRVSEAEFVSHFTRVNLNPVKCYGALFDSIDCHGNGFITNGEFNTYKWHKNPNLLGLLGVSSWEDFVASVDVNEDGVISRDEFISHYAGMQDSGQLLSFTSEACGEPPAKQART